MAEATVKPSSPAPEAHPVPSDAELVKMAFDAVWNTQEMLGDIKDYAGALGLMVGSLPEHARDPIGKLAALIEDTSDALEEERRRLCTALHPRRGEPGT